MKIEHIITVVLVVAIPAGFIVWDIKTQKPPIPLKHYEGSDTLFCAAPRTPVATDNEHYFCTSSNIPRFTTMISPRECDLRNGVWYTKNHDIEGKSVWVPGQDCQLYGPYPPVSK